MSRASWSRSACARSRKVAPEPSAVSITALVKSPSTPVMSGCTAGRWKTG